MMMMFSRPTTGNIKSALAELRLGRLSKLFSMLGVKRREKKKPSVMPGSQLDQIYGVVENAVIMRFMGVRGYVILNLKGNLLYLPHKCRPSKFYIIDRGLVLC